MTKLITYIAGILIALNVQGQSKIKPRVDLEYFREDSVIYLGVKVRNKIEKRFEPMENVQVDFVLETDDESVGLGSIVTNAKGEGKVKVSDTAQRLLAHLDEYRFAAHVNGNADTEESSGEVTILPGRLKIETAEADQRLIKIAVESKIDGEWIPYEGAEIRVFIKRTFGQLSVGEDVYTSDENGWIELPFEEEIPGDSEGNILVGCVLEDHDDLGTVSAITTVKWGMPFKDEVNVNKRSLWSTRDKAPLWLLIFPNMIIAAVWGVIVYLVYQIFKIKRLGDARTNRMD